MSRKKRSIPTYTAEHLSREHNEALSETFLKSAQGSSLRGDNLDIALTSVVRDKSPSKQTSFGASCLVLFHRKKNQDKQHFNN